MRLLVIEDDFHIADLLARALASEGHVVEEAADGVTGLEDLRTGKFDVCILDLELPGLHGFRVLEEARRQGVTTPILILTGLDTAPERVRGLNLGADDFITKPFSIEELFARVNAVLRRGTRQLDGKLRIAGLVLDPSTRRVVVERKQVKLSQKQYALLEYLLRHRGKTISRATLLERVWGYTFDTRTNIVDVQIALLRQRIDKPGRRSMIETVRGIGYRIRHDEVE